jgi:preprotein translocase subunit SecG
MHLVRLAIWLATLFCATMLFVPLIQEVVRRAGTTGQLP